MKKRTMVTIIKTLNDVPYAEAMKELLAVGDSKATVQRSPFGWKIGLMGWKDPEQVYEPVATKLLELRSPVYKPLVEVVDSPEGGFAFQVTTDPQGYEPNHGNVVSFEELLAS